MQGDGLGVFGPTEIARMKSALDVTVKIVQRQRGDDALGHLLRLRAARLVFEFVEAGATDPQFIAQSAARRLNSQIRYFTFGEDQPGQTFLMLPYSISDQGRRDAP